MKRDEVKGEAIQPQKEQDILDHRQNHEQHDNA